MIKKTDQAIIHGFLEDSSNLTGAHADGIYLPENPVEGKEAVKEIGQNKSSLTIVGGATGTTGGCLPFGGWLLSTQKLNRIITLDDKQMFAVVEPGVTLNDIEAALKPLGLFYPPDPTEKTATIGGNVATNASGSRGYRFGATRNWVRRLKVVLTSGEVLDIPRGLKINTKALHSSSLIPIPHYQMPKTKNAAGYFAKQDMDLIDLFIGAEGTLGIVTEIEIALLPIMKETFDLVSFFASEGQAVAFVFAAKREKDKTINFFEYFDANTLQMLKNNYPHIPNNAQAAVYVEQEITAANKNNYLDFWAQLLEQSQASLDNCWLGIAPNQRIELEKFRHAIPEHINELFKQNHLVKMATDLAVPADKFREMFNFYNSQLTTNQLFYIKFGHIGENHLHVNLLPKTKEQKQQADDLIMRFVKKAVSLNGTVSAEHGIGKIKHQYLKELYGASGIKEMIEVKKHFDPTFFLNRNNIFPSSAFRPAQAD
ncbi:FAD-binding oxidoreductase [Candidatus Saganbacteria bacterium]|nr:FAD-binding oxidoreductase [Candidatus Saganbacteria bacterium]